MQETDLTIQYEGYDQKKPFQFSFGDHKLRVISTNTKMGLRCAPTLKCYYDADMEITRPFKIQIGAFTYEVIITNIHSEIDSLLTVDLGFVESISTTEVFLMVSMLNSVYPQILNPRERP